MLKTVLRLATASVLMSAALTATAGKSSYQDLEINGTLQEIPGPSARCASQFGGTILGYGESNVLGKVGCSALILAPLVGLDKVTKSRVRLNVFPLKMADSCGSPCRAIIIEE